MRVIDARSGKELNIGDRVDYGHGEWLQLLGVTPGFRSATATIRRAYRDMSRAEPTVTPLPQSISGSPVMLDPLTAPIITDVVVDLPLVVRFTHPKYFLQHVAFIPS